MSSCVTPLAKAVLPGRLEVVRTLLDAGADPYFRAPFSSLDTATLISDPRAADDILKPPRGTKLARIVPEFLTETSSVQFFQEDSSAFGFAARTGRRRVLHEFLRRYPSIPPTPSSQN